MRLPKMAGWLLAGAGTGLMCMIAAGLVSFAWPDQYVSSALLLFRPSYVPEQALEGRKLEIELRLDAMVSDVLSRTNLARIIQSPEIDLYTRERRRSPIEDAVDTMRKQVRLERNDSASTLRISFGYPDAHKAQLVVDALAAAMVGLNERINRSPRTDWLPRSVGDLEIVDVPSLPERSVGPDRYAIAGIGLLAGFLLGVVGFAMRRISRRQTQRATAAALCGFVVAGGLTFLLPAETFANPLARLPFAGLGAAAGLLAWAVVRGGRAAWRRPHYGWPALAGGALGAIAAGFAAYAIPVRYESTAALRMYASAGTSTPTEDARERFGEIQDEVLSRTSLSEVVLRPSLDLYHRERQRRPMEDIIGNMRGNDLRIEPTFETSSGPSPVLPARISFAYPDRHKAQAVVREIVTRITEQNAVIGRRRALGAAPAGTISMVVLDPASLPQEPLFPQSPAAMAAAAGAGALLALVLVFLRRRPQGQAPAMLKMGAAGAAVGALLAGAIAFAIPARYVSTAVLRIRPGTGGKVSARHVADYVRQETPAVLSRSSLAGLIQRPELDLYRGERARHPLEQVIDKMLEDLRIEPPAPARLAATFSIAFTYADRFKAQAAVRELASMFVEPQTKYLQETPGFAPGPAAAGPTTGTKLADLFRSTDLKAQALVPELAPDATGPAIEFASPDSMKAQALLPNKTLDLDLTDARLEVLDPASLPEAPVWPPRGGIVAGGLLAGLLLGLAAQFPAFASAISRLYRASA